MLKWKHLVFMICLLILTTISLQAATLLSAGYSRHYSPMFASYPISSGRDAANGFSMDLFAGPCGFTLDVLDLGLRDSGERRMMFMASTKLQVPVYLFSPYIATGYEWASDIKDFRSNDVGSLNVFYRYGIELNLLQIIALTAEASFVYDDWTDALLNWYKDVFAWKGANSIVSFGIKLTL